MKKQKSSIINLSEFSSSDEETEKATPKIDKEELIKYLKDSDEESSQDQITPKRPKNVKRLKVMISKSFRKSQRNLVLIHSSILKEKITNT